MSDNRQSNDKGQSNDKNRDSRNQQNPGREEGADKKRQDERGGNNTPRR